MIFSYINRFFFFTILLVSATDAKAYYTGVYELNKNSDKYYISFEDGQIINPILKFDIKNKVINTIYIDDSLKIKNVDINLLRNKGDSLIDLFITNFTGFKINLDKNSTIKSIGKTINRGVFKDADDGLQISFYPNGKPYCICFTINKKIYGNLYYFKRNGGLRELITLDNNNLESEITLQNLYDYREKNNKEKYIIGKLEQDLSN